MMGCSNPHPHCQVGLTRASSCPPLAGATSRGQHAAIRNRDDRARFLLNEQLP